MKTNISLSLSVENVEWLSKKASAEEVTRSLYVDDLLTREREEEQMREGGVLE